MAWNNLKLSLVNAIFPNTTKLIDAETHQDFESELIDALGALQYRGVVIPSTNLGYIDGTAWVLAKTAGTYANFSGQVLVAGDIAILKYNGTSWSKDIILNGKLNVLLFSNKLLYLTSILKSFLGTSINALLF